MCAIEKRGGALHGGIFLTAVAVTAVSLPPLSWPWPMLLPLLIYAAIVLAISPLRRTAPRLEVGRLGGPPFASVTALALTSSAVLIGFHSLAQPNVTDLAARLPLATFGNLLFAGVCFSTINAALEEIIFRGILWGAVAEEWNDGVAMVVTTVLFGLCHMYGYPPGAFGAVLAGLYGLALGIVRWWTGGLGLTVLCHLFADATIFIIIVKSGTFDQIEKTPPSITMALGSYGSTQ